MLFFVFKHREQVSRMNVSTISERKSFNKVKSKQTRKMHIFKLKEHTTILKLVTHLKTKSTVNFPRFPKKASIIYLECVCLKHVFNVCVFL